MTTSTTELTPDLGLTQRGFAYRPELDESVQHLRDIVRQLPLYGRIKKCHLAGRTREEAKADVQVIQDAIDAELYKLWFRGYRIPELTKASGRGNCADRIRRHRLKIGEIAS